MTKLLSKAIVLNPSLGSLVAAQGMVPKSSTHRRTFSPSTARRN